MYLYNLFVIPACPESSMQLILRFPMHFVCGNDNDFAHNKNRHYLALLTKVRTARKWRFVKALQLLKMLMQEWIVF